MARQHPSLRERIHSHVKAPWTRKTPAQTSMFSLLDITLQITPFILFFLFIFFSSFLSFSCHFSSLRCKKGVSGHSRSLSNPASFSDGDQNQIPGETHKKGAKKVNGVLK